MYHLRSIPVEGAGEGVTITAAFTNDGHYIGNEDWAKTLQERGVAPTVRDGTEVCSIGFCEAEQKWYGWSHRAMFGFGVGSTVKKGDCAYQPMDEADFREDCLRFWAGEGSYIFSGHVEDAVIDGVRGALVIGIYSDDTPNAGIRGASYERFTPYPDSFGRGEWTAQTLEDARQMAEDFAEDVG